MIGGGVSLSGSHNNRRLAIDCRNDEHQATASCEGWPLFFLVAATRWSGIKIWMRFPVTAQPIFRYVVVVTGAVLASGS